MKRLLTLCACVLAAASGGSAVAAATPSPHPMAKHAMAAPHGIGKKVTTKSGLSYVDLVIGKGPMPKVGQTISVLYTGRLTNGTVFDSTGSRNNAPFETPIGVGEVIKGWDEGMLTMRVGGKRRLTIPPSLGYGASAQGPIPANSTLIFDVELLAIR
jgi:peptidylprolyl isomerase